MTSCKGNVVQAVLQAIERCDEHARTLRQLPPDAESVRERALDIVQDLEQQLCQLAAMFITAPISGRIFTPLPHEYVSEAERVLSLEEQMR
jgi:hypothetical protein